MVFTIAVHTITLALPFVSNYNLTWYFYEMLVIIFFTCNGLFFMLSGKFTLGFENLDTKSFKAYYLEKLIKIVIPFIFYSALIFLTKNIYSGNSFELGKYINGLYQGNIMSSYWFIYSLLGIYLVAPFIYRMISSLNKKELKILIFIIFLVQSISVYSGNFIFTGWISYFILGYAIEKIFDSKNNLKYIALFGFLSLILPIVLLRLFSISIPGIHDLSITMVLVTSAVFFIARNISLHLKRFSSFLSIFSKYFLSVYLVHEMVLKIISKLILINNSGFELIFKLFLIFLLTLMISIIIGFCLDNLILKPIQKKLKSILL